MSLNFEATLSVVESWNTGGNGNIKIKNLGSSVTDWSFNLTTTNFTIGSFWNLSKVGTGNVITIKPPSWQRSLNSGATIESGFSFTGSTELNASSSTQGVKIILPGVPNPGPTGSTGPTPGPSGSTGTNPNPGPSGNTGSNGPGDKKVFAYFSEWSIYDRQFSVSQIPVNLVTHILYAFMLPNPSQADYDLLKRNNPFPPLPYRAPPAVPEGQLVFHDEYAGQGNITNLKNLKAQNPNVKILISIGGWTLSWTLSKIAANPTLRNTFIKSSVDFVINNGFDGIDIDWEYVGVQGIGYNYVDPVNDTPNFITMLKEMRTYMDQRSPNKHLEITAAMGCNPGVINNYRGTEPYMDYILLMTYDFAGSWGNGGHHSGLYNNPAGDMDPQWNAYRAVENAKNIGYPINKICMGCPIYGRGWQRIVPNNPSLPIFGQSTGGPAPSYSGSAGEPGMSSWRHLRDVVNKNGLQRYYDGVAQGVFVHNSSS